MMRWTRTVPREGDTRERTRFAFVPTRMGGPVPRGEVLWVWLEFHRVTYTYRGRRWERAKRVPTRKLVEARRR